MIIDFSIENFMSIKEKIEFSMEATGTSGLKKNTFDTSKNKYLKSSVIYGGNATGKTNILRSLTFAGNLVVNSHNFNISNKIPNRIPYMLDTESFDKPTKFEINFIYEKIKYKYCFSCNNEKIIEEYLYYYPNEKETLVFTRKNTTDYEFNYKDRKDQEIIKKQMISNVLYVSRATQLGHEITKNVYNFFNNLVVNFSLAPVVLNWQNYTLKSIYDNKGLKKEILEVLSRGDFGGINDIIITKKKGVIKNIIVENNAIKQQDAEGEIYEAQFIHDNENGRHSFNLGQESAGTQKMFSMLGPIFDVLNNGKIMIVDELEASLHPFISKFIVKMFSSKHNKKNAQLIFSTHDINLIDNELFRKDQIYFCEKKPNSNTKLISMAEYDIRQDANFYKAYINGKIGGIPFTDETYVE